MVFQLVDRILDVRLGERIVAAKQVVTEDFLIDGHLQGGRYLPYPVVIEALAQAGGLLITATSDFRRRSVLGGIQSMRPGRPARVGDWLDLVAEVDSRSEDALLFRLRATCEGEEVAAADGVLAVLVDSSDLEDPERTRERYEELCRGQGSTEAPPGEPVAEDWVAYDTLEEMVPDQRARAHKAMPLSHPLFSAHFPRFPVVPGALVMHSLICLSQELLAAGTSNGRWGLEAIRAAKFQRYIRPEERMIFETRLLQRTEREAQFSAAVTVAGKPAMVLRRLSFASRD